MVKLQANNGCAGEKRERGERRKKGQGKQSSLDPCVLRGKRTVARKEGERRGIYWSGLCAGAAGLWNTASRPAARGPARRRAGEVGGGRLPLGGRGGPAATPPALPRPQKGKRGAALGRAHRATGAATGPPRQPRARTQATTTTYANEGEAFWARDAGGKWAMLVRNWPPFWRGHVKPLAHFTRGYWDISAPFALHFILL